MHIISPADACNLDLWELGELTRFHFMLCYLMSGHSGVSWSHHLVLITCLTNKFQLNCMNFTFFCLHLMQRHKRFSHAA